MKLKTDKLQSVVIGIFMILTAGCSESVPENARSAEQTKSATAVVVSAEDAEMARGKVVFASCALCHSTSVGGRSTIGPNLAGVLGSAAGSKNDFPYSEALNNSGIVWNEKALNDYIESPATYLPGGTMAFIGVADELDRKAVLTYLIAKTDSENTDPSLDSDQGDDVAAWE
jgi:cytochrome c